MSTLGTEDMQHALLFISDDRLSVFGSERRISQMFPSFFQACHPFPSHPVLDSLAVIGPFTLADAAQR